MRPIDADRAIEIVRDQGIAHPNAYHLTNYATLILQEAPTLTDLSKCLAFNSTADDKPQTNADRIRAMSDKELATDLLDMFQDICDDGVPSKEWMLEWLKQPAE